MIRNLILASALILVAAPSFAEDGAERKCDKCGEKFERKFNAKDTNGDGVLTADEAPKIVEHADADGDGKVTKREAKEALKKHLERKRKGGEGKDKRPSRA